uniref:hypothetical protein n=1 Tax=Flavobacterium filum TaxID=370974 RepID=UPI0023F3DB67
MLLWVTSPYFGNEAPKPNMIVANVLQICEVAGFLPQMIMRSTKLSATTKLSAEHETPPIANVLL